MQAAKRAGLLSFKQKRRISKSSCSSRCKKKTDEFSKNVQEIINQANRQFREESLKIILESYQGLTPENIESIKAIWADTTHDLSEEKLQTIMDGLMNDLVTRENEKMRDILGKTSTFLYDSIGANLQSMLKELLKESIRKELGDSDSVKSFGSAGK